MLNIKDFESKVLRVNQETAEIKSFQFSVPDDFSFKPAQHIVLELPVDGKKQMKSFSISSSPSKKGYIETTKRIGPSEYSKVMGSLKEGDVVRIKGPYGLFLLNEEKDAVMIAGGIGITPFKDMIEYASEKELPIKITLLFSNKTPEDIPFKEELDELDRKNPDLKIIHTITRPNQSKEEWNGLTGHINEEMIRKEVESFEGKVFYICGPPSMVNEVVAILEKMEIPKEQIKLERFTGYDGED